jgi:hypothetical protein
MDGRPAPTLQGDLDNFRAQTSRPVSIVAGCWIVVPAPATEKCGEAVADAR